MFFSAFFGYVKTNSRRNSGARFKFDGLRLESRCVYHLSFYYHMFCDDIAAMVMVVGYNPTQKLLYSSSRHGRNIFCHYFLYSMLKRLSSLSL